MNEREQQFEVSAIHVAYGHSGLTVAEALQAGLEELRKYGWVGGKLFGRLNDPDATRCTWAALNSAINVATPQYSYYGTCFDYYVRNKAVRALLDAIEGDYVHEHEDVEDNDLIQLWNDEPGRTQQDVEKLFMQAIDNEVK